MVFRIFACQCGHGFLRKVEDQEITTTGYHAVRKKKKQNEKPKLNMNPSKPVSQKGVGEFFPDAPQTPIPVTPPSKESAKVIPGLSVGGQKPLRLNLDLSSFQLTETKPGNPAAPGRSELGDDGQPRLRTASTEDIFNSDLSDDDLEEEEEKTEQWSWMIEEIMALRLENEKLKEKMMAERMAERRLYQKYQEELLEENRSLEMKSRDLARSMQEKDGKRIETLEELTRLVVNSSAGTEENHVKGK